MSWLALLLIGVAHAAPPENADPALAPWFQSLHSRTGISCCSIADCRNLPTYTTGTGYEVLYQGQMVPIPPEAVSDRTDNPTGSPVTCVYPDVLTNGRTVILCFFRAPGA